MDFAQAMAVASHRIRALAARKGIALAHLADRAGIGRTTMWRLLDVNQRGPSDPRVSTILGLAGELGVGLDVIFAPATEAELAAAAGETAGVVGGEP